MSLTRRDMIKVGGISAGIFIAGRLIEQPITQLFRSFQNDYGLGFEVNIFADKEKTAEKLPEKLKYMSYNTDYLKISPINIGSNDDIKILNNSHTELPTDYGHAFSERPTNEKKFYLIVTSHSIEGTRKFQFTQKFLDNEEILDNIIGGIYGENQEIDRRGFYYGSQDSKFEVFRTPHNKSINLEKIPEGFIMQLKGDSITYNIQGLEALTKNNPDKLNRYWESQRAAYDALKLQSS